MPMSQTCTRVLEFDAAHRVPKHGGKCSTLHGHRYKVEITCAAPALDEVGVVIDFGKIKEVVGGWIDAHLDHTTLLQDTDTGLLDFCMQEAALGKRAPFVTPLPPTAENLAVLLLAIAHDLLAPMQVVRVRVWETPNCYADAP